MKHRFIAVGLALAAFLAAACTPNDGKAAPFALVAMERKPPGFSPDTNDWRFKLIGPDDAKVRYCAECHATARRQDFLLFVPPGLRL